MYWMHIMSPEISRRAHSEWLDTVPVTKIFASGCAYCVPAKIYSGLLLARINLAAVLADKIRSERMTGSDALKIAKLLLNDNSKRLYELSSR